MRGSQKVPENVVQQCNGWTYDNDYLITYKIQLLHTHTHLLHRFCRRWKHRRKASFGIFCSSAVAFHWMSSIVAKCVPLRPIFRVGNSQKSLGARSGDYGGWVMTGTLFSARNYCTTRDVLLGAKAWLGSHFHNKFMNVFNMHFTPKLLRSNINIPPYLFSDVIAVVGFVWGN
jgi:hypothetical protein